MIKAYLIIIGLMLQLTNIHSQNDSAINNRKFELGFSVYKLKYLLAINTNASYHFSEKKNQFCSLTLFSNSLDFNVGVKNLTIISVNKGFRKSTKKMTFSSTVGIGPHYFQLSIEEVNFRNIGVSLLNLNSIYFHLKKLNIGFGVNSSIGYGYHMNYTNLPQQKFAITPSLAPCFLINF